MNKTAGIIVVVIVLVLGAFLLMRDGDKTAQEETGKVYVAITDAAASLDNISEIRMTVSKVEMHSEAEGWVTVSSDSRTFNLLELKSSGEFMLAGEADVAAGTYNQTRLMVDKIEVEKKDGTKSEAKLPSGELKIVGNVVVNADSDSSVTLDFLADQSLHATGRGEFIFAPVIKVESKSDATVTVENNVVMVSGGTVTTNTTLGADLDGSLKANFQLDTSGGVNIEDGVIKLNIGGGASGSGSAGANTGGLGAGTSAGATTSGGIQIN